MLRAAAAEVVPRLLHSQVPAVNFSIGVPVTAISASRRPSVRRRTLLLVRTSLIAVAIGLAVWWGRQVLERSQDEIPVSYTLLRIPPGLTSEEAMRLPRVILPDDTDSLVLTFEAPPQAVANVAYAGRIRGAGGVEVRLPSDLRFRPFEDMLVMDLVIDLKPIADGTLAIELTPQLPHEPVAFEIQLLRRPRSDL